MEHKQEQKVTIVSYIALIFAIVFFSGLLAKATG
ncbi:MAG: hypothetical protein PWP71_1712 [Clostridia bacterium]|jgi:hypothetical protein|nr:hypothetical protein [Clostridia bacterium]